MPAWVLHSSKRKIRVHMLRRKIKQSHGYKVWWEEGSYLSEWWEKASNRQYLSEDVQEVKDWASWTPGESPSRKGTSKGLRNGTVPATSMLNQKASTAITYLLLYSQWMRWRALGEGSWRVKTRLWRAHGQHKTAEVYLKAEVKPFTCIWREEASSDSHLLSWGDNTL